MFGREIYRLKYSAVSIIRLVLFSSVQTVQTVLSKKRIFSIISLETKDIYPNCHYFVGFLVYNEMKCSDSPGKNSLEAGN